MKKRSNKNKTTELFKLDMFVKTIIPSLGFKGARMLYPYTWNGISKFAEIDAHRLFKIIKWDIKQ